MTDAAAETLSVVVERDLPHAPEKVWRALTQPHLMEEWLMKSNFDPTVGRPFKFTADWGAVEGEVIQAEPLKSITYSWNAYDLKSTVTWTLTQTPTGTRLRVEQAGFRPDQIHYYEGAKAGWPNFLSALEQTLAKQKD